jgi:predicted nucleotidyltransferase
MNIADLHNNNLLLLNCISGSKAHGLNTPQSDTDLKGIFALPKKKYYGFEFIEQVNNESNDEVYYELRRFFDLLIKNNPNILELLNTPQDCILYKHPLLDLIKPDLFLSKLCKQSFAGYAQSQIKKAKGLNKKIVNPIEKERKTVLDFCHVVHQQGALSLKQWLEINNILQEHCGLVAIHHMRDMYALFHNNQCKNTFLKGIFSGVEANDILLSSVESELNPIAIMSFNKDGYSKYCKEYKEYWEWVEVRNENRFENTIDHGKNYDTKNMMHTFRLLNMAEEIATEKKINVRRHDRDFLLNIRSGHFTYEELVERANEKIGKIDDLFERSDLPETPDIIQAENILIEIREKLYRI